MNEQIKRLQQDLQLNQTMIKELRSQIQTEKSQTEEFKEKHLESKRQFERLEKSNNEKSRQIEQLNVNNHIFKYCNFVSDIKLLYIYAYNVIACIEQVNNVKHESLKKDQQIMELTKNIQELQSEMNQNKIEFKKQLEQSQHKQVIQNNLDNQRQYISQLQSQTDVQNEEGKREEKNMTKYERNVTCQNMLAVVRSPCLNNGVDFLLVNENKKVITLKNKQWNIYNFGVYLLGRNITLTVPMEYQTVDSQRARFKDLGHLCIKTSHLWIKDVSSNIDCSRLGHEPGEGGENDGEETLLKEIHCGSGSEAKGDRSQARDGRSQARDGRSEAEWWKWARGGGIIELIVEQQLINNGSIRSNAGNRRNCNGSGGSILIELQCHSQSQSNDLQQTVGTVTCLGADQSDSNCIGNRSKDGRIAIYGIELSADDIKKIAPKPFNRLQR
ncbi:hypothetical protein RFI_29209 [Reticulomyxa filosa]|uniref:Uncharacterized protein n=1 Tax=Reticulomyxa filosa TaxID=46433 RepID=X6M2N9_RETFI|nr:hypothetical protein RFI_29209 [Reticulomyxa filosa]|eukprot:ETO08179.1 hypothetical protein RFI_29209 [Reticulomyxa filosa]